MLTRTLPVRLCTSFCAYQLRGADGQRIPWDYGRFWTHRGARDPAVKHQFAWICGVWLRLASDWLDLNETWLGRVLLGSGNMACTAKRIAKGDDEGNGWPSRSWKIRADIILERARWRSVFRLEGKGSIVNWTKPDCWLVLDNVWKAIDGFRVTNQNIGNPRHCGLASMLYHSDISKD